MKIYFGTETRTGYLSYELARTTRLIFEEIFPIQMGENVVITADTSTDSRVVNSTAEAIFTLGGHPIVIWYESLPNAATAPPSPVTAALREADAWIEYAPAYLLHGPAHREAINSGCRMLCLTAMDVDGLVRTFSMQDPILVEELENKLRELSQSAMCIRVTSPAGTNLTVEVEKEVVIKDRQPSNGKRGYTQFPPGASGFNHQLSTVQGVLVFDGAIFPPKGIGVLESPVILDIKDGYVKEIQGGDQAKNFKDWLSRWNDPLMYQIAHFSYGCNPGINRCSGRSAEDARVFGSMDIGLGITSGGAPTHTDGIVLNPSIWADDELLEKEGKYIHPELVSICKKLDVLGY